MNEEKVYSKRSITMNLQFAVESREQCNCHMLVTSQSNETQRILYRKLHWGQSTYRVRECNMLLEK